MNNTLQNGFKLLEYLSSTAQEHSVTELTEIFSLPKSHVCRLLKTLISTGYIEQNPVSRKYKVCLKVLCLANACLKNLRIRERAKPYIHALQETLQTPVFLAVPLNGEALLIDAFFPKGRETDPGMVIGSLNGPYDSATGKICAAWLNDKEINELILRLPPVKRTEYTLTKPEDIYKEFKKVRTNKLAITKNERSLGVSAIAAPVFSHGGIMTASIGTILPPNENTPETWQLFEREIRDAAVSASFAMGDPDYGMN